MPYINLYLADDELQYIRQQKRGYLRELLTNDPEYLARHNPNSVAPLGDVVGSEEVQKIIEGTRVVKEITAGSIVKIPLGKKGDGLHTCKKCGSMLPFYKGKCKNC